MPDELVLSQEQKLARLTSRELAAYDAYSRLNQPPMAPSTQMAFFQLFLSGISCEEIVRINPSGFSLGAIVRARIENNWDEKRLEHQRNLVDKVRGNVQQTILETVEQLTLEMKVYNKLKRDKLLKYLQTGDEKHLEGLSIGSTKALKDVAEALLKLTGQDGEKKTMVGGSIEHRHVVESAPQTVIPALPVGKPISAEDAAKALEAIHRQRGGK
jgi:hypothetical protein